MSHDVTNFLPHDRVQAFERRYVIRLVIVALFATACVLVVHTILALPTYWYALDEYAFQKTQLEQLSATASSDDQEGVTKRIAAVENHAERLVAFAQNPTASAVIADILLVSHPGVHLTGIAVDVSSVGEEHRLRLTGDADSREALRSYHVALSGLPTVSTADLPLSAYAKETDIPFTITITSTTP